jgi:uncharacterized membrane protein
MAAIALSQAPAIPTRSGVAEAEQQSETTRIGAFSDGVFAIAITLLVLEIVDARGAGGAVHAAGAGNE